MGKYYGLIGFAETKETEPSVYEEVITERRYYGDISRNTRRLSSNDKINNDISIGNDLSIIADPYARYNFHKIIYAEFMGTKWKVESVNEQYPRLILSLGAMYNA